MPVYSVLWLTAEQWNRFVWKGVMRDGHLSKSASGRVYVCILFVADRLTNLRWWPLTTGICTCVMGSDCNR